MLTRFLEAELRPGLAVGKGAGLLVLDGALERDFLTLQVCYLSLELVYLDAQVVIVLNSLAEHHEQIDRDQGAGGIKEVGAGEPGPRQVRKRIEDWALHGFSISG